MDRISLLPDELLCHILFFFPSTKLRVQTSILSRRWRHLWCSTPALDFPQDDYPNASTYIAFVDHCFRLYTAPTLDRFYATGSGIYLADIDDDDIENEAYMDSWIRFAASHFVCHLQLSLFLVPISISLCFQQLSSLKLYDCCLQRFPPNFNGFPSLKALFLSDVAFFNNDAAALISACPLLETLYLHNCSCLTRLEISSCYNPHLVNLNMGTCECVIFYLNVQVPSLRFFSFEGDMVELHMQVSPNLRAVQILTENWDRLQGQKDWDELLSVIANSKSLALNCWFFEFALDMNNGSLLGNQLYIFKNLKELHWFMVSITEDNLLACVLCLRECPILEKLCINHDYNQEFNKAETRHSNAQMYIQQHKHLLQQLIEDDRVLLSRLKAFIVNYFSPEGHAMQLMEFILGRATVLELLQLSTIIDKELDLELLHKEISGFVHASQNVHIQISKVDENSYDEDVEPFANLWSFSIKKV